ncbi:transposase, partial [Thiolapillus sp.]
MPWKPVRTRKAGCPILFTSASIPCRVFARQPSRRWAEQALDVDTLMVSDGLAGFLAAGAQATHHQRVVVHPRKSSELDCFHWINTLLGNLKNSIRGTCHGF